MAEEQVIETLRLEIKLDKNFSKEDLASIASSLNKINSSGAKTRGTTKDISSMNNSFKHLNFAAMLSSMTRMYHIATRLGSKMAQIAQGGMDYNETLNLWSVSMRGFNKEATKFLDKMNDAYGVSEQTLMNAQATFKNMIGSLGQISSESAYILSEGITQMALDYASLYNVSIESAMTKFQAALAGQVRPIRTGTGLDITENTLFQFYQELGGEKTVRQLNRTEKQLLAILAVYKQMEASGAIGDMAKTIDYAANQSRVMAETWSDISDYAGLMLIHLLESNDFFININAALMVVSDVLKALADGMGAIRKESEVSGGLAEGLDEIAGGAEGANTEIEKLKNTLFGFDKFQVLGDASGGLEADLDSKIIEAFERYKGITEGFKMQARLIADDWLEMFGFIKDSNGELVLSADQMETIIASAKNLASIIGGIGAAIIAIKTFGTGWIGAIAGLVSYLYVTNEDFRESINNLLLSLLPLKNLLGVFFQLLNPILDILNPIIGGVGEILDLFTLILIPVSFVLETLVKILDTIIATGKALMTWDWGSFGERMKTWSNWSSGQMVEDWTYVRNVKAGKIDTQNTSAYVDSSRLEASIARGTIAGMSSMSTDVSPTALDVDVAVDGQSLFQIFRGVARRNGYDLVEVR